MTGHPAGDGGVVGRRSLEGAGREAAAFGVPGRPAHVVRLLFGGDVMLGRGVAPIAARSSPWIAWPALGPAATLKFQKTR